MSTKARLGVVLAAVVVLVVGFVVLGNRTDDSPSSTAADVVTATTTQTPAGTATTTAAPAEATPAAPAVPTLRVRDGGPVGKARTLRFDSGDRVRFRVVVDAPQEVHVHGFDIEEEATPAKPATFSFPADIEGAYDIELHSTDTQIATLEIEP